jgi:hypothetical protein
MHRVQHRLVAIECVLDIAIIDERRPDGNEIIDRLISTPSRTALICVGDFRGGGTIALVTPGAPFCNDRERPDPPSKSIMHNARGYRCYTR